MEMLIYKLVTTLNRHRSPTKVA